VSRAITEAARVPSLAESTAEIHGNRAGLVGLRGLIDAALAAEGRMASISYGYRATDGRRCDVSVQRATRREQMGEPKKPDRPAYSAFT